MFSTSFMNRDDLLDSSVKWIPSTLFVQNYIDAGKSMDFWVSLLKGIVIAGVPTLCNVAVCMLVGYGFARFEFKGKKILLGLLIFSYILPSQVTMIPTYVLYNNMKIVGTLWAFILPAIFGNGLNSAIFILIFYQFFRQVPKVLIEAAQIDGAGYFKSFVKIAVPSAGPAILTVFLFSFVWYWNETSQSSLLFGSAIKTLPMKLGSFADSYRSLYAPEVSFSSVNEAVSLAGTLLSVLPLLIFYLILQRQFVESIEKSGITGE